MTIGDIEIQALLKEIDRYKKVFKDIKAEIIEHAYPVRYDHNSIEKGMTITGIEQVFDKHNPDKVGKEKKTEWGKE